MSPYAETPTSNFQSATDLFGDVRLLAPKRKNKRGDLVLFFQDALHKNQGYMFRRLKHVSTDDLFYIKSVFLDKQHRPCKACSEFQTGYCAHSKERAKSYFNWATETKKEA